MNESPCAGRRPALTAFTLTELLVVIGIIVLLVGILIPVVSKVKQKANAADSAAFVAQLDGAIKRYHEAFRAYPGPLSNAEVRSTAAFPNATAFPGGFRSAAPAGYAPSDPVVSKFTGTENLVLGLLGGLRVDTSGATALVYDPSAIGQGPSSLNAANPKRYEPFIDPVNLSWQTVNGLRTGKYGDEALPLTDEDSGGADDTIIPEFVDRFPDPMPILYLRARVGAAKTGTAASTATNNGIVNAAGDKTATQQYDLDQIIAYTGTYTGGALDSPQPVAPTGSVQSIGVGKDFSDYKNASGTGFKPASQYHGLRFYSDPDVEPKAALEYLRSPSFPDAPRQKDGYLLISAGPDRVYGTNDDITNFGGQ